MSEEINFGDYAILDAYEYHFEKAPDLYWKINPVTSGNELARAKFLMHNRVFEDVNGNRYEQPPTALEIAHREIALLYGGTNIATRDGKPILGEKANLNEVERTIGKFPPEMVAEIWIKIGELYPKWGPADPNDWKAG